MFPTIMKDFDIFFVHCFFCETICMVVYIDKHLGTRLVTMFTNTIRSSNHEPPKHEFATNKNVILNAMPGWVWN